MIEENLRYIHVYPVEHEGVIEYQVVQDPEDAWYGVGQWRNTAEKIEKVRSLNVIHDFGPHTDCIAKTLKCDEGGQYDLWIVEAEIVSPKIRINQAEESLILHQKA